MPDEVFNKSSQAVGGAQRADAVTSFVAAGTNVGCGPESADKRKTEIYGTAMPPRRTRVVHTSNGDHDLPGENRMRVRSQFNPSPGSDHAQVRGPCLGRLRRCAIAQGGTTLK